MQLILELILRWFVPFVLASAAGAALAYGKKSRKETQSMRDGMQCLLRAEIIRQYEKWTERSYCPIYAREALIIAYQAYHNLGGNDVATELYQKTTALPTEPSKHKEEDNENKL